MLTTKIKALLLVLFISFSLINCINIDDSLNKNYPKKVSIEYKLSSPSLTKAKVEFTNDTGGDNVVYFYQAP